MKLDHTLVVLDLETTGTWVEKDKIIEIGMLKWLPDGSEEEFLRRVNPSIHIPEAISRLIGIRDEDVAGCPLFRDIAPDVIEFIGDADLGGFNIERFDLRVLEREIKYSGMDFDRRGRIIYDAQKVYHVNEKRDLPAAYKFYCNRELKNGHTAMADTKAALEILKAQAERYCGGDNFGALRRFEYDSPAEYLDKERKMRWWNKDLYPMFGKYAGKCSIREIARIDSGYLEWILKRDFSPEVKKAAEDALMGRYPVYPEK